MKISDKARQSAQQLLNFIDASPSPWHAVASAKHTLLTAGFTELFEVDAWQLSPNSAYFVSRGDASLIAFRTSAHALIDTGFAMVGAHTDSPGLRLKPNAAFTNHGTLSLGVEVYGGPILATFTDRDLSLAGRVQVRVNAGLDTNKHTQHSVCENRLSRFENSTVRLPNLAIHMNREVNDKGLKLNKQTELPLIFGAYETSGKSSPQDVFIAAVANQLGVKTTDILGWEFNVFDTQKGVFWGQDNAFIANSQLDNLASCHAALTAITQVAQPNKTTICALFDHEEVGSESATGASGSFLNDVVTRIIESDCKNATQEKRARILSKSFFISADMAHAYHPNHPNAYEPCHHVHVNQGIVIKHNANQRYATNGDTAAKIILLCEQANVPFQQYSHRSDLGCGSTIGPMIASGLGVATADIGAPMWAMHSLRESAGVCDHQYMIDLLATFYAN